jgi:nucleotide-binding universal stress UspA family protein
MHASLTFCMVNPLMPGRGPPIAIWSDFHVGKILDQASGRAAFRGVRAVRTDTWCAMSVPDSIVAYADKEEIDLIIVGSRDRSALARALGSSVSRELLRKANCPILLVNRMRDEAPASGRGGTHIRALFPRTSE